MTQYIFDGSVKSSMIFLSFLRDKISHSLVCSSPSAHISYDTKYKENKNLEALDTYIVHNKLIFFRLSGAASYDATVL